MGSASGNSSGRRTLQGLTNKLLPTFETTSLLSSSHFSRRHLLGALSNFLLLEPAFLVGAIPHQQHTPKVCVCACVCVCVRACVYVLCVCACVCVCVVCVCLCVCTCVRAYVYLTGSRRVLLHYSVLQASYQGLEERVGKLAALQRGWLRGGGRNSPYLGLVNLYRIFCRESMEFTAIYGVYVRLWPTLHILP
jgi:hypothetical protein